MGNTVFITEKPSVAQEYRKVLGISPSGKTDGYVEGYSSVLGKNVIITWAVGHLVGLSAPSSQNPEWEKWNKANLPMIPNQFKYEPQKDTYKQFKIVKDIYKDKDTDAIYYAGDSGREGIYIQALIRNMVFGDGTIENAKVPSRIDEKVVWIDSYTEESILNGIKNAKSYSHYQPMIDSGYERARRDWLIGMNFTQAFTLSCGGYKNVLNVGRVKTPTLSMVVDRQKEIDDFKKTDYFGIKTNDGITWKADKNSRYYDSPLLYNDNGFLKEDDAKKLKAEFDNDKRLMVEDVKVQTKTEYAPLLFNLADLQNFCSKKYHISPSQTLSVAQSLYEKKLTTYPRTDARVLSSAVATELKSKYGYNVPKKYVDDSKITDHYAIIPTFQGSISGLSDLELKIFNDIKGRFEDTLKPPFVYDAVSVTYKHSNNEHLFEGFRIVKDKGYKGNSNEDLEDVKNKPIPNKGDIISVNSFDINAMETKPPVAYTTGSLIMAMEKSGKLIEDEELREQIKTCGIGTSATRSSIIDELIKGQFMTVDKSQKITPTEKGKNLIAIIKKYDEHLTSPLKTAEMEQELNNIATGTNSVSEYKNGFVSYITDTCKTVCYSEKTSIVSNNQPTNEHPYNCPCCKKQLKNGKFGYYCDKNNDGCGFSIGLEICGAKITEKDVKSICENGVSTLKKMTSKAGKPFEAYLRVNVENKKFDFSFPEKNRDGEHER